MIILFEENEKSFSTLGLGVLKDATSCIVREKLNDEFSLSMEYPVKGSNFSKIKNNRIICVKPNPYSEPQAFRIYSVTKAINGRVIVDANHISYDTNSIPVKAFSATSLQDVLVQIQNGCIVDNPFALSSDISRSKSYKTTAPYNLRAILMSDEESIVTEYDAELEFDNYVIKILAKRGKNRGAIVRYGYNMTDINHSLSTDLLYNGVFPYYHTEKTSTETTTADEFPQVYIVGSKTYQDGWLSYSKDGEPYHPMDESPVQIATEGEYYQKVFTWNTLYNVYQERVYNEQVTIIQGLTEPSWLTIDWSHFPLIVIKAAQKGYYKKATDTDWGEIKGVGDIIFEGSVTSSGLMENLIISYSEVIPSKSTSKNEEVTEVVDVQLDQPIMWIETNDAKAMLHDRILMLDLTSEFEEEPSQINLRAKAEEYISKHKIGTVKHSTTLSFVDLSATTEGSRFENLDHVELGDTVKVIYEDANIEVELRVITTEYDVLSGRYNSVELGEKKDKMSNSTIQNGDNVSALTNDVGYATVTTVNKLIANIVTANYIEALNAKLSSAQISQLSVERINCTGIIEASQFTIDSLVAKLLVADNAEIADTLTAGNIKVAGDIAINSGQITITSDKGTKFIVDRDGNLTANSVSITGGNLNINDGVFEVTNDGVLTATAADITGSIRAKEGEIASFVIAEKQLHYGDLGENSSVIVSPGIEGTISNLDSASKYWAFTASNKFGVTTSGVLYAKDAILSGTITATAGYIANFRILEDRIATYSGDTTYNWSSTGNGIYLGSYGLKLGDGFKVSTDGNMTLTKGSLEIQNGAYSLSTGAFDSSATYYEKDIWGDYNEVSLTAQTYQPDTYYLYDGTKSFFQVDSRGNVTANSIDITGGEITIGGSRLNPIFKVTQAGELSARSAVISGSLNIKDGEIILGGNEYNYQYEAVTLTSSSYKKNVYYTKSGNNYVLSTGDFVSGTQYYKYKSGANFYVSDSGAVEATNIKISGGEITIKDSQQNITFNVTNEGAVTATNATITGTVNASSGKIGNDTKYFTIAANTSKAYLYSGVTSLTDTAHDGVYIGTDGIRLGKKFYVENDGTVHANDILWIVSEEIKYAKGINSSTTPSTWVDSVSQLNLQQGDYLWTRIKYLYNNATYSDPMYTVTYIAEDGPEGPQGPEGPEGPEGPQGPRGSDADVTWTNILEAFRVAGSTTTKGIYYGTDGDGNNALLINATAGYIGGWTIYKGYLGYGTLGQNDSFFISTSGLTGTVAGNAVSSTETDANKKWGLTLGSNFGVTLGGAVYSSNINITGGSLNIGDGNFSVSNNGYLSLKTGSGEYANEVTINPSYTGIKMTSGSTSSSGDQWFKYNMIEYARSTMDVTFVAHTGGLGYPQPSPSTSYYSGIVLHRYNPAARWSMQYGTQYVWEEGISIFSVNYANSSAGAKSNWTNLYIGRYKQDFATTQKQVGFPNDIYCSSGWFRDKWGILPGVIRATWPGGTDNHVNDTNAIVHDDMDRGIAMVVGRFYISNDGWYTWNLAATFSTIISVTLGCDAMSKWNHSGHGDTADYYQDGTTVYIGNDRGSSGYVSCIVVGIPYGYE